jgi:hypothetical protein
VTFDSGTFDRRIFDRETRLKSDEFLSNHALKNIGDFFFFWQSMRETKDFVFFQSIHSNMAILPIFTDVC